MISLDRTAVTIGAVTTGASFSAATSAQAVRLTQSGAGVVSWTATPSVPWLVVSPSSGNGSATLSISAQFAAGLTAAQTGSVTLTFIGAGNTVTPVTVTLRVVNAQTAAAPSGAFDTPLDGATGINGSITVTGWAVDDVEVTAVRILRDPIAGEAPGQPVLIGHATLVDGAGPMSRDSSRRRRAARAPGWVWGSRSGARWPTSTPGR